MSLAACNSGDGAGNDSSAQAGNISADGSTTAGGPMARVLAAMASVLVDPSAAQYSNVREGSARSVCGSVAARQRNGTHGPALPFVVTPEGLALVSPTPRLAWNEPEDPFPTAYARWCATPEELEALRAQIATSPVPRAPEVPPADLDFGNEADPPAPVELPKEAPSPTPRRPAPAEPPSDPNDVSFANAVRRSDQ
jgi:hypothetical protein